jgi:hypothetical protein
MSAGVATEQRSRTFTWEDPAAVAAEGLIAHATTGCVILG